MERPAAVAGKALYTLEEAVEAFKKQVAGQSNCQLSAISFVASKDGAFS